MEAVKYSMHFNAVQKDNDPFLKPLVFDVAEQEILDSISEEPSGRESHVDKVFENLFNKTTTVPPLSTPEAKYLSVQKPRKVMTDEEIFAELRKICRLTDPKDIYQTKKESVIF